MVHFFKIASPRMLWRLLVPCLVLGIGFWWSADAQEPEMTPDSAREINDRAGEVQAGRRLFDRSCAYCHGLDGDGNGPVAGFLSVRPRDFTRGVYKFRTTESGSIPTELDIYRTISRGVHGTEMMAWSSLTDRELWQLVYYLQSLSPRFSEEAPEPIDFSPPPFADFRSVERGRKLYSKAKCGSCHGSGGAGDGPSVPTLRDDQGDPITPRDLNRGANFGRGSTALAIYEVLSTGIDGTPMPSYRGVFPDTALWDLANYVSFLAGTNRGQTGR